MMYFHRYIRLTPVVAVVVLYIMSLYKYSGAGPMWMKLGTQDKRCEKSWWATLIYVQNYAFPYKIVSLLRRWKGIPSKTFNYPLVYFFFFSASVSRGIWPSTHSCMSYHHFSLFPCGSGARRLLDQLPSLAFSAWVALLPHSCTTNSLCSVSMTTKLNCDNVLHTIPHIPVFQHG